MEVNDFMDLNTTELFDDSNDSFDENEEGDNSVMNISDDVNIGAENSPDSERIGNVNDDVHSADAGTTIATTDVVSLDFFTSFIVILFHPSRSE